MKGDFIKIWIFLIGLLFLFGIGGCTSVSEECVTNGYILESDCKPLTCEERGYILESSCNPPDCLSQGYVQPTQCVDIVDCVSQGYVGMNDVNILINFTNSLIETTNECTGENISPLLYFDTSLLNR